MRTFVSLLPAKPIAVLALAAVLLDRAGADPDAIREGVTVIECPRYLAVDLADGIDEVVFGDEAGRSWSMDAGKAIILSCVSDVDFRRALSRGVPVVVIDCADSLPRDADVHGDRRYTILPDVSDQVIKLVVKTVTGGEVSDVDARALAGRIDNDTLVATARSSLTADVVVDRLRALIAKRADDATKRAAVVKADKVDSSRVDDIPLGDLLASAEKTPVKLSDLSGYGAARDWGMQLASELRAYKSGDLDWSDIDRGILLYGAPGTGKTYFARALAAECEVPLVLSSYSDWESGTGGSAYVVKSMRKIFDDARKKAPCIVFIDEIDSLGVRGGSGHNNGYWDAIINALLGELDGANPRDGVIAIAATNNPSNVDGALKRPGRLERQVEIPMPTVDEIGGIILHHGIPDDGDFQMAAVACRGKSPATIAMLCREAKRIARTLKRGVCMLDVVDAVTLTRPERDDALDRVICLHEAGHAVIDAMMGNDLYSVDADAKQTVTRANTILTREAVRSDLVSLLAARRAEAMLGAGASSGAMGDLAKATWLARSAVSQWGLGSTIRHHSDDEATRSRAIRDEVDDMLESADLAAAKLVDQHRDAILAVAEALRERRFLDGAEVAEIVGIDHARHA